MANTNQGGRQGGSQKSGQQGMGKDQSGQRQQGMGRDQGDTQRQAGTGSENLGQSGRSKTDDDTEGNRGDSNR